MYLKIQKKKDNGIAICVSITNKNYYFFFYRFKWKENGQTDLPYANPFTISTIPALSGATVDKFSKPTTVNSKMVCKQLIIILKIKYDISNVSPARYDIFLKRKIFYFFLLYLLSIRYHVQRYPSSHIIETMFNSLM